MERLTPETAKTVSLPAWWRVFARDRAIRGHFAALGIPTHPMSKYVRRSELSTAIQAQYEYFAAIAAPSLSVEVLTDLGPAESGAFSAQQQLNQGEEING